MYLLQLYLLFLVADTQLYKRPCPSVRWSVGWLVRHGDRVEKCENAHFCPCPPVRNWYWPCIRPCCFFFWLFQVVVVLSMQLIRYAVTCGKSISVSIMFYRLDLCIDQIEKSLKLTKSCDIVHGDFTFLEYVDNGFVGIFEVVIILSILGHQKCSVSGQ